MRITEKKFKVHCRVLKRSRKATSGTSETRDGPRSEIKKPKCKLFKSLSVDIFLSTFLDFQWRL